MLKNLLIIIWVFSSILHGQNQADLFEKILQQHVDSRGMVDYTSIQKDNRFQKVINRIEKARVDTLNRDQRLVFFINAYNALVIKNVIDHWPLQSPLDVNGFFKEIKFSVAGERLTLDQIEHNKIFPIDEILVHFGLVCAAHSCPRLIRTSYRAESVWKQLEQNGRLFLRDSGKNRLNREKNILYLSKIFEWFQTNFVKRFGSLQAAAGHFMSEDDASYIKNNNPEIQFLEYNWNLNRQ